MCAGTNHHRNGWRTRLWVVIYLKLSNVGKVNLITLPVTTNGRNNFFVSSKYYKYLCRVFSMLSYWMKYRIYCEQRWDLKAFPSVGHFFFLCLSNFLRIGWNAHRYQRLSLREGSAGGGGAWGWEIRLMGINFAAGFEHNFMTVLTVSRLQFQKRH